MGFEDDMDDLRAEQNAPAPLTEDEKAAIVRAEEFAHLNRNRPVFFDGKEIHGEFTINGKNDGAKIIVDIRDDDISTHVTGARTASINEIHFDKHSAKAAITREAISDPTRIEINQARRFAEEHEGAEVTVEGYDHVFTVNGLSHKGQIGVETKYENVRGLPGTLSTSVSLDTITLLDQDHDHDLEDGEPDLTNVVDLEL